MGRLLAPAGRIGRPCLCTRLLASPTAGYSKRDARSRQGGLHLISWNRVGCSLALLPWLIAPAFAAEQAAPASDERAWLPIAAAAAAIVPGAGYVLLGEPSQASYALGAVALPVALGSWVPYPSVFADLPDQKIPLWFLTAQETWSIQIYMTFQEGRRLTANKGLAHPLQQLSVGDVLLAPFQSAQIFDAQVWSAVATMFMTGLLIDEFLPDPDQPPTPFVFTAKSAQLLGQPVPAGVGYGANALAGGVLALHAGVGEETLFRGVFQDELEQSLGTWGGLGVSSALFGLAHVGGINQTSSVKQFLGPGSAGLILGRLYQTSGYDLRKSIAAHAYYDTLSFLLSALRPQQAGNNVLGVQFTF
jgi:membrane protease YdiL (CAAX protease family)